MIINKMSMSNCLQNIGLKSYVIFIKNYLIKLKYRKETCGRKDE